MAEDNNGDIDRAMAAFATSPMRYYTPAPTPPGEAARISGVETSGSHRVGSEQAAAFPLLIAALPGINRAPMPVPPIGMNTVSGQPRMPSPEAKQAELRTRPARALERPVTQPPNMMSSPQIGRVPNLSAVLSLPVRHATPTQMASQLPPGPHVGNIRTTTIATMFHALSAADPSHDAPAETRSGLQDLFSRL